MLLSLRVCFSYSPGLRGSVSNLGTIMWGQNRGCILYLCLHCLEKLVLVSLGGSLLPWSPLPQSSDRRIFPRDHPLHLVKRTLIICTQLLLTYFISWKILSPTSFTHRVCRESSQAIFVSISVSLWSTSSRGWSIGFIVDLTVSKSTVTLSWLKIAFALACRTLTWETPFGT